MARQRSLLHPRGVAAHPRRASTTTTRRRWSEVLTGTSLVGLDLIDAIKARFPGSWTSVAYGSTEIGRGLVLVDSDLYDRPGSVGQPPPMVTTDVADDGELLVARSDHVLRLPRPTRRHRRGDRPRRVVPHRRPRDQRRRRLLHHHRPRSESIRSGGEWVAPVEVETAIARTPRWPRSRWSGIPDPTLGRGGVRGDRRATGRALPTVDELRAHVAVGARRSEAARGSSSRWRSSPAPTPPVRFAVADCATRSSPRARPHSSRRGRRAPNVIARPVCIRLHP